MKTKVSPAIVGMFVIGAFALGVIGLLTFGGVSFFSKPQRFVVYFDESVHGLNLGSSVQLRGVPVGRVVDLNVHYDGKSHHSVVAVVCEFSKNKVTDSKGNAIDVANRTELQNLVDNGLRARLDVQGLATGLLFVELEFLSPKDYPADNHITELKYVVVPYVPSAISEFQTNLTEILNDIKKVDFAGIGKEVKLLLADAHKQLDGLDIKGLVAQWQKAGASVDSLVNSPETKQTLANLNSTLIELHAVLVKLDAQVDSNGDELKATLVQTKETLASFNAAADTARRFIAAQGNLGTDAGHALSQLSDAAESVQRLAEFLERNPQALISGKRPRK
ncbi:MAG: MlaD family protein [Opitutaceae bacterium]